MAKKKKPTAKPKKKSEEKLKIREISPEEFNLEEKIETSESEIIDEEFHEFLRAPTTGSGTPVLNAIGNVPEQPDLEQTLGTSRGRGEEKKEDEEKKYKTISETYEDVASTLRNQTNEDMVLRGVLPTMSEPQRINFNLNEERFEINPELQEMRRHSERRFERDYITGVKEGEFKEKKTRSPFEQEERKYDFKA